MSPSETREIAAVNHQTDCDQDGNGATACDEAHDNGVVEVQRSKGNTKCQWSKYVLKQAKTADPTEQSGSKVIFGHFGVNEPFIESPEGIPTIARQTSQGRQQPRNILAALWHWMPTIWQQGLQSDRHKTWNPAGTRQETRQSSHQTEKCPHSASRQRAPRRKRGECKRFCEAANANLCLDRGNRFAVNSPEEHTGWLAPHAKDELPVNEQ